MNFSSSLIPKELGGWNGGHEERREAVAYHPPSLRSGSEGVIGWTPQRTRSWCLEVEIRRVSEICAVLCLMSPLAS